MRIRITLAAALVSVATLAVAQEPPVAAPASPAAEAPKAEAAPAPAALPAPAAAPTAEPAKAEAKSAAPKYTPTLWGFIDFQYSRNDPPAPAKDVSTFELRRARIGVRGDIHPSVGYAVLWDGADTALKDAYGVLKNIPGLPGVELRAGQFKTTFGYEQPESDTKLLWVNTSYAVAALARGPDSRDEGVAVIERFALPNGMGLDLVASVVNGAGPNKKDDLEEKNFWGRAGVSGKAGRAVVKAGLSYGYGRQVQSLGTDGRFNRGGAQNNGVAATANDDVYFWFNTYGADVTVDCPYASLAAEFIQSERDLQTYVTGGGFVRSEVLARGWYVGAVGKTPWNVGPVVRVERYDRNVHGRNDVNRRTTVGVYADIIPVNARLIFNYDFDDSDRRLRTSATAPFGNRAILFGQVIF